MPKFLGPRETLLLRSSRRFAITSRSHGTRFSTFAKLFPPMELVSSSFHPVVREHCSRTRGRKAHRNGNSGTRKRNEEVRTGKKRKDPSSHVAGANGVSNGVGQSLPALKHERASYPSPLARALSFSNVASLLRFADAYNNERAIINGIIIIDRSMAFVLLLRLRFFFSSPLAPPRYSRASR